jgi:hypothetical protein
LFFRILDSSYKQLQFCGYTGIAMEKKINSSDTLHALRDQILPSKHQNSSVMVPIDSTTSFPLLLLKLVTANPNFLHALLLGVKTEALPPLQRRMKLHRRAMTMMHVSMSPTGQ